MFLNISTFVHFFRTKTSCVSSKIVSISFPHYLFNNGDTSGFFFSQIYKVYKYYKIFQLRKNFFLNFSELYIIRDKFVEKAKKTGVKSA